MQTIPNPAELTLHVRLKPEGVQAGYARKEREREVALRPFATGVCVGSVTLELWVMKGTCSWSALLLQISETSTLHWLQSAQVSWLGLCGPETSPWSAGTSLIASIECHADDRQTLFHPFSLVGCQG